MSIKMECLIPGLIDDLGRECLLRVPLPGLPTAMSVCKSWNSEISHSDFRRKRKLSGLTRPVLVLAQAGSNDPGNRSGHGLLKEDLPKPGCRLVLSDPMEGTWVGLPEIPGLPEGVPVFCGVVSVGSDLVVLGGLDPVTCRASSCVYVYNFLSGTWRRGENMPGVKRSFFGYGSDLEGMIMIVGGHDEDKNALKSAFIYDVVNGVWVPLPDMTRERDECKVIFHRGKFHVISGYPTDMQGSFDRTTETFDSATWQWDPIIDDFLEIGVTPGSCMASRDGRVYACTCSHNADVAVQQGDRWQVVTKVPTDVLSSYSANVCGDKLVVIGCPNYGGPNKGYMLDLNKYKWSKIDVPKEYNGLVQSSCVVEI